jgi:cytosine/adenosine deaminase-related metal-dependent hydrolase
MRTLIHGGDIVAHHEGGHRLLRGGALVFEDDRIAFVGRAAPGPVDQRIDATGQLVIPGLVNIHCHGDVEAAGSWPTAAGATSFRPASSTTTPPRGA